jgi:hypothetical protein
MAVDGFVTLYADGSSYRIISIGDMGEFVPMVVCRIDKPREPANCEWVKLPIGQWFTYMLPEPQRRQLIPKSVA